jgi:sec-independent protein translocase protein TatB
MFSFGFGEILVIGVILLLVVGPDRLPQLLRQAGRAYGQLRRSAEELRRAFMMEADRIDAALKVKDLEERRAEIAEHRRKAIEAAGEGAVAQTGQARFPEPTPANEVVPSGFSEAEWAELPEHLRRSVWNAIERGKQGE